MLTPLEAKELFENLRRLRDDGKAIVFISHKLDEVLDIADRITVLRRGRVVGETRPAETTKAKLAEMMVGRPVLFRLEKPEVEPGEPVLEVDGLLAEGKLNGISLQVRAREILGIAGVEGNGQRELAEALIGLRPPAAGSITLAGQDIAGWSVAEIRNAGVAYIPEDRQEQGLVLNMTLWENAVLGREDDRVVLRPRRLPVHPEDQGDGAAAGQALRRPGQDHQRQRRHPVGWEPAEADPRPRAGHQPEAVDRVPADPRARRGRDRVRLASDPRPEGGRQGRPPDLGRAGRDLRALRSHRDDLRGADHRRVSRPTPRRKRSVSACSDAPTPRRRADGRRRGIDPGGTHPLARGRRRDRPGRRAPRRARRGPARRIADRGRVRRESRSRSTARSSTSPSAMRRRSPRCSPRRRRSCSRRSRWRCASRPGCSTSGSRGSTCSRW